MRYYLCIDGDYSFTIIGQHCHANCGYIMFQPGNTREGYMGLLETFVETEIFLDNPKARFNVNEVFNTIWIECEPEHITYLMLKGSN